VKIYRGCENGAKSSNSKPLVTDMSVFVSLSVM